MSRLVVDSHGIDATTAVGGKARSLAALADAGLPVPRWFVVLPAAFEASVPPSIASAEAGKGDLPALRAAVQRSALAPEVEAAIEAALAAFADTDRFAVRSSAQDEDGARHSFAGQLESFLGVERRQVAEHVARVWASAYGERLARYRTQAGLAGGGGAPAVIVQRMVEGEASGVAFSADPVSGRRSIAVIAAAAGRGDALVSGEAEGATWRVDRAGAIVERPAATARAVMDDAAVRRVAALARSAERHFGVPQDIEWTLERGTLHLLQSRPITTLAALPDPDAPRALWDNANIIESYSGVTTPLTFSFARRCYEQVYREFCRLVGVPASVVDAHGEIFACMLGLHRGRVYYNLLNWYRLLALLPGYALNRRLMEQMMGVREPLPDDAAPQAPGRRLAGALALARTLALLAWRIATLPSRERAFLARLDAALGTRRPDLSGLRPDELAAYYRRLEGQLLRRWDAPIVNDFATMVFHGLLRRLCAAWAGDTTGELANELLGDAGGETSEMPARLIRAIAVQVAPDEALVALLCEATRPRIDEALRARPDAEAAFAAYVERYGERCLEELKLESATVYDDPLPLYRAVGRCARQLAPPAGPEREATGVTASNPARRRLRSTRPLHRACLAWVLQRARRHVAARERLRFERTRVFDRARQIFVEMGRRLAANDCLDAPRDVFYLECDEVLAWAENRATTTDLKGLVAVREAEFATFRTLPAPVERFETRGVACRGHDYRAARTLPPPEGDSLSGVGCCPGVVRGRVRIVTNPAATALEPGEILVAERTDPGWVMVFPAAAGLLVERGSLLSHSAIVARELGLPTIVSLPGVTQWLRDGDRVEMDGGTGRVTRLAGGERAGDRHDR